MIRVDDPLTSDQRAELSGAIAALDSMTIGELRRRHRTVFGQATSSRHRSWLVRRIAWKLQEQAEGGLSKRAQNRAAELAQGLPFRERRPSDHHSTAQPVATKVVALPATAHDPLAPGTVLRRTWQGQTIQATVHPHGFEYDGTMYRSLSALATKVTGTKWNGYTFFGLRKQRKGQQA
jgi:hypothetical protein